MKVCIAEKPSVAREIAKIVGAKARKDGYFEGNGYAVTWTFGHFCTLYPPDEYNIRWKRWDLNTLPMLPEKFETRLIHDTGVKKQFAVIKKLFKTASVVINCGDAGQEGELIQRWVIKEAKYTGPVQRLWISSLTNEAIKEGFNSLKDAKIYDRLYYAGSARAIGDWLLGMNATRLYTLKHGGYKQVLSIGRVQTPTLSMIVERHLEIENFNSAPFWEVQVEYRETSFNYVGGRFDAAESGQQLVDKITGKDFTIDSTERKEGKEYAPKLFDLTSLQVYCNKKYSYSADQTLKLVQKLYEMKMVTYPRVDTNYLPEDQYPKIKGIIQNLKKHARFTAEVLSKPIKKSSRVFDNDKITDHHAIIPTGNENHVDGGLANVYDAIVLTFLANFYPVCRVANSTILGSVESEEFKTTGKEILVPGWKILFPPSKKKEDKEEKTLPNFKEGESGPHVPTLTEKKTQPPKYYTEATLLRAMETAGKTVDNDELKELMKANGIGRPSTRASIIETLFKRKYIKRRRKQILATDTGVSLIQTIQNDLLKSPELTGQWEKQLSEIEQGRYNPKLFINDMKKMVDQLVTEVRMEKSKSIAYVSPTPSKGKSRKKTTPKTAKSKSPSDSTCPKCNKGRILKGNKAYGCTAWKEGCKLNIPFTFLGKKISDNQFKRLLNKGCTVNLKGFDVNGEKQEGLVRFDKEYNLVFEPKKGTVAAKSPIPLCPICKKGSIIKGKTAYGCSQWQSGCTFKFPFENLRQKANGQPLTKELVLKILSESK